MSSLSRVVKTREETEWLKGLGEVVRVTMCTNDNKERTILRRDGGLGTGRLRDEKGQRSPGKTYLSQGSPKPGVVSGFDENTSGSHWRYNNLGYLVI